ncbi:MAG: two-component system response regulator CreB [Gammaproteobacteria bacterium MedPE]|nr:MAG: two-component system response regulator CreB [Gammaproteobacteria bacterium MedPE]
MTKKRILVVEDEQAIADTVIHVLENEGFVVDWVSLGSDAIVSLSQEQYALMVLDVGLPDINGFEVCKNIRIHYDLPIIFLTARSEEIDRVVGLEIGGDDYVTKPFSPRELAARVKVILKRVNQASVEVTQSGRLQIAPSGCDFLLHNQLLSLTSIEFKLLQHMYQHTGVVMSRDQLLTAGGFAHDAGYERNIDSHIKSLRAKLRKFDDNEYIKTHRGFGYSLNEIA